MLDPLILVVQHDAGVSSRIEQELAQAGMRVAGPVAELARALARAEGQVLKAVLLDLYLPDSSGSETVDRFLRRHPDLPVIATAPRRFEAEARAAVEKGARFYLLDEEIGRGLIAPVVRDSARGTAGEETGAPEAGSSRRLLHDLGNLLGVVSGEAEMLVAQADDGNDLAEDIRELDAAIAESVRMFRKYVASRRVEARDPGPS